jgi:uncharacterized protein with HEPN domain
LRDGRSDILLAKDILKSIDLITTWTVSVNHNELYRSGVVRELSVIGEAAKRLSDSFKELCSDIPWRAIAGSRDVAVHRYWETEWARIEKTIAEDLPALRAAVMSALDTLQS